MPLPATAMADETKYEVLEKIGHGSFGVIRKVKRRSTGEILCRKEISYGRMSQKEKDQLKAEIQILSCLRHPNIVAYYHQEHLKQSSDIHLYMEYCGHGDLGRTIRTLKTTRRLAPEPYVWDIFAQLTTALYRCHYDSDPPSVGGDFVGTEIASIEALPRAKSRIMIIHRDLKPENVFLGDGNSVKLGDFGLSKQMTTDFASTYVGTPYYMSPEIVNAEQYSLKSDIWSLGCIIYELCALNPPFDAKTHLSLCQKIKAGRYPDIPSNYSCHLKEAIGQCLKVHPDRRPDTAGLLNLSGLRLASMQRSARVKEHELQVREQALAAREKALSRQALQAEAQKKSIENSVNAQLHREWEVKANLAITENTNARLKELEREFEMRLHNRVGLEVARRLQQLQVAKLEFTGSTSPVRARHPVAMTRSREDYDVTGEDDCPSMTYLSSVSLESPVSRRVSSRMQRTPFVEKARLLEIQSPMDIEMTEASPMVTIPSLALSPRRKSGASRLAPIGRNIFAEAAGPKQNIDPADHALPESDEEEYTDDARPSEEGSLEDDKSPTFLIPAMKTRKEDPFTSDPAKKVSSRPSLGARQQTMPSRVMVASRHQLNAPTITGNPPPHRANHFSTLEAPVRRREPLSTLPVANRTNILPPSMQLQTEPQNPTSPNRSRGGLKSKALHHGGDAMLRAVTTHNLMKENVSTSNQCATVTKRTTMVNPSSPERRLAGGAIGLASRMLGDAGSDTTPPVWDLEDVDCPSPFLKRQRSAISRVSAWVE